LPTEVALGVDGFSGAPVLAGQPVVGQVQVDLGGADRPVPGLSLQGFEGHAGLAKPREAGVAQLVTGAVGQPRSLAGAVMISSNLLPSVADLGGDP